MAAIRWGILGTGQIAGLFATGLAALPEVELAAVGSRAAATAAAFGDRFRIPRRYASYEALAADPAIDIVYVATPHPLHAPCTRLCLEAGKAVLCEKPFTVNAAEARAVVDLARQRGLFLMVAMWTRFLPLMTRLRELAANGAIGEPRLLIADFGFHHEPDPAHRLFNPDLAGGALLDVGVYLVSLASMLFGRPDRIASLMQLATTGVDEQDAVALGYDDGRLAQLTMSIRTPTRQEATLYGTAGSILIHPRWWRGERLTLTRDGQPPQEIALPLSGNGYNYEAAAAMQCLRSGARECDVMPLDETVTIMAALDRIRADWGLRFPMEPGPAKER